MAFGEIITNISSVYIKDMKAIKLSANWMANSSCDIELLNFFEKDSISGLPGVVNENASWVFW